MPRRHERGSSLVEAAIVMSLVLVTLFGIIDFGRAVYTYAFVAQIARQGARWAIVRGSSCTKLNDCNATPAQIQAYLQSLSEGATAASNITLANNSPQYLNCPPGEQNDAPGCTISITVQYPFDFVYPGWPMMITMSSTSQMVISQ